jgi:hypothetical protein
VANPTVDVATTTSFYVTASIGTCSVADTITVTEGAPVAPFSFTNSTFCPGTAGAIALPAGPAGMTSYQWEPASQVLNPTSNGPTATTLNPRPQVATTYTLTVTNADGCTGSAAVTLTPSVSLPDAGVDRVLCRNAGPVSIGSASNPTSGFTYAWTPNPIAATLGTLSSYTSVNPTFTTGSAAGTATLTLTKTETATGCQVTDQVVIRVNDLTLPALSSPTICQGASVQIGTTPVNGVDYFWNPATGLSSTNIANPIASPLATTTYTLTGVGINGCADTKNVIVTVRADTAPAISLPDIEGCISTTATLNPTVTPAGTYSYVWTPNNGLLSNLNIANPTVLIPAVGTQTFNLVVTDTSTGCSNTESVLVTGKIQSVVSGGGSAVACVNVPITDIVFTTTGATGIGTPTGLPPGVTASFNSNTITISGVPTVSDIYDYSIPLLGGCDTTYARGTIEILACSILPVELVSFQAMVDNCNVNLKMGNSIRAQ